MHVEDLLADKKTTVDKLSKNIQRLQDIAELQETYGSDIDKEENAGNLRDSNDNVIKVPKKRTKMDPNVMKKVTYESIGIKMPVAKKEFKEDEMPMDDAPEHKAYFMSLNYERKVVFDPKTGRETVQVGGDGAKGKYAQNAMQLDLVPTTTKIKNLTKVVKSQTTKLKSDKPVQPFKPGAASFDLSKIPAPVVKDKKPKQEEDESKKRKGILERENIFRRPFEKD